jgi:hypothetical protein
MKHILLILTAIITLNGNEATASIRHLFPKDSILKMQQKLDSILLCDELATAIRVSMDGEKVYEKYYGNTGLKYFKKPDSTTLFGIASMSKQFTCMAILILINYKEMFEPVSLNDGQVIDYGLGMGITNFEGKRLYYHPGMGDGMNSINLLFPEYNLDITVIRNVSGAHMSSADTGLLVAHYCLPEI